MVFWVHAGSVPLVRESFRKIAVELRIPGANNVNSNSLRLVHRKLSTQIFRSWLLILDNLDDESILEERMGERPQNPGLGTEGVDLLSNFIPVSSKGTVLITSRNKEASRLLLNDLGCQSAACLVSVPPMSQQDSLALIKARLPEVSQSNEEEACELVKDLEYFPLAISQAAAYITQQYSTISKYRKMFQESDSSKLNLLQQGSKEIRRGERPNHAVLFTWNISFRYIQTRHPSSGELLRAASFFSCQSIPSKLLSALLEPEHDLNTVIGPLLRYHLMSPKHTDESYDLHRLVQLATRFSLKATNDISKYSRAALKALQSSLPEDVTLESRESYALMAPHASEIEKHHFDQREDLLESASISMLMTEYWRNDASYLQADCAASRAVAIRSKLLGNDDIDTILAKYRKCLSLLFLSKGSEAEILIHEVMNSAETVGDNEDRQLPSYHILVAKFYQILAQALDIEGKYVESETWLQKALRRNELAGKLHGSKFAIIMSLVINLSHQSKFVEAERVCRSGLHDTFEIYGENDMDVTEFKYQLGRIMIDLSRYKEAAVYLEQAYAETLRTRGEKHAKPILIAGEIVRLRYEQGNNPDILHECTDVISRAEAIFGSTHMITLRFLSMKGTILIKLEKFNDALEIHAKVLSLREQILGQKHPDTIVSTYQLAVSHYKLEEFDISDNLIANALKLAEEVLGPDHNYTIMLRHDNAVILERKGLIEEAINEQRICLDFATKKLNRKGEKLVLDVTYGLVRYLCISQQYEEALQYSRDATQMCESLSLEDKSLSTFVRCKEAEILEKLGNEAKAENILRDAVSELDVILGGEHNDTLDRVRALADFLRRQSRFEEAESLYNSLIVNYSKLFGPDDSRVLRNMNELALTYRFQQKLPLAETTDRKLLETRQRLLPSNSKEIYLSMNNLGMVLYQSQQYDEATHLLRKAIIGRSQVLGPFHKYTRQSEMNLLDIYGARSDWSQADALLDSMLSSKREKFGSSHRECLTVWAEVFDKWLALKRYDKIVQNRMLVVDQHLSSFGQHHAQSLRVIGTVGQALLEKGLIDEAEATFHRLYQPSPKRISGVSPKLTYVFKYANLLKSRKKFKEMEAFAQQLLVEGIEFYGKSSHIAQCSRLICATSLFEQFQISAAVEIFWINVVIDEEIHGLRSSQLTSSIQFYLNLVTQDSTLSTASEQFILRYMGTLLSEEQKSLEMIQTLTSIARTLLSKSHPEAVNAFSAIITHNIYLSGLESPEVVDLRAELAHALFATHQLHEATTEARQVLTLKEKILGPRSPSTIKSRSDLAIILAKAGSHYEALDVGRDAFIDRREILGEDNLETVITQGNYGSIQLRCGHYADSERTLRAAVAKHKVAALRKPGQFGIIHTVNLLARTLIRRRKFCEAEQMLREAPEELVMIGPKHHWSMARTALLAQAVASQGKLKEAETLAEDTLTRRRTILGPDHSDVLLSMYDLAKIYHERRQLDRACEVATRTLKRMRAIYGNSHPSTFDLAWLMSVILWDKGLVRLVEERLREAVAMGREVLREEHPRFKEAEGDYVLFLVQRKRGGGGREGRGMRNVGW